MMTTQEMIGAIQKRRTHQKRKRRVADGTKNMITQELMETDKKKGTREKKQRVEEIIQDVKKQRILF